MLFLLISFAALQTNALPQFHLPFSRFPEFGMATADMPDLEENFQIPETDLRMSLPKMDSKNVNKTSSKKKMKDGTVIETTNINGPNFMMHEESAFKSSKGGMKGVEGSNLPALGSFLLGGIPLLGDLVDAKSPFALKKCKPKCKSSEFCDEVIGKCVSRLKAGSMCDEDKQCESKLFCVWGTCNIAKAGDAGTKCNSKRDCGAEMNCLRLSNFGSKSKNCVPKLNEGAVCSLSPIANEESVNPCMEQLKCASVGITQLKICNRKTFVEPKSIFEDMKDKKSSGEKKGEKNENEEEEESGDDDDGEKVTSKKPKEIPAKGKGNKKKGDKKNDKLKFTS